MESVFSKVFPKMLCLSKLGGWEIHWYGIGTIPDFQTSPISWQKKPSTTSLVSIHELKPCSCDWANFVWQSVAVWLHVHHGTVWFLIVFFLMMWQSADNVASGFQYHVLSSCTRAISKYPSEQVSYVVTATIETSALVICKQQLDAYKEIYVHSSWTQVQGSHRCTLKYNQITTFLVANSVPRKLHGLIDASMVQCTKSKLIQTIPDSSNTNLINWVEMPSVTVTNLKLEVNRIPRTEQVQSVSWWTWWTSCENALMFVTLASKCAAGLPVFGWEGNCPTCATRKSQTDVRLKYSVRVQVFSRFLFEPRRAISSSLVCLPFCQPSDLPFLWCVLSFHPILLTAWNNGSSLPCHRDLLLEVVGQLINSASFEANIGVRYHLFAIFIEGCATILIRIDRKSVV